MPLILAIEPDGRQAALLLKLARGPLNAKLVVAESTERALATFRHGVPDLILTSRRLSKKDEKALADRLKALAAAAAHVQRLVIPVFAPPGPARGKKHIARTRRSSNNLSEGCDPEIFAEQIAEYLERAAAERALIAAGTAATAAADLEPAPELKLTPEPAAEVNSAQDAPSIARTMDDLLTGAIAAKSTSKRSVHSRPVTVTPAPQPLAPPDVVAPLDVETAAPVEPTRVASDDVEQEIDLSEFLEEVANEKAADAAITIDSTTIEPTTIEPVKETLPDSTTESIFAGAVDELLSSEAAATIDSTATASVELGDISQIDLSTYVAQIEAIEDVTSAALEIVADTTADELAIEFASIAIEPPAAAPPEPIASDASATVDPSHAAFDVRDLDAEFFAALEEADAAELSAMPVPPPAVTPAPTAVEVTAIDESTAAPSEAVTETPLELPTPISSEIAEPVVESVPLESAAVEPPVPIVSLEPPQSEATLSDAPRRGSLLSRLQGWLSGNRSRVPLADALRVTMSETPAPAVEPIVQTAAPDAVIEPTIHAVASETSAGVTPEPQLAVAPSHMIELFDLEAAPALSGVEPSAEPSVSDALVEEATTVAAVTASTVSIVPDITVSIGDDEPLSSYIDQFESTKDAAELILLEPVAELEAVTHLGVGAEIAAAPVIEALESRAEALPAFELIPEAMEAVELLIGVAAVEPSIETIAADSLIEAGQHELNFDVVDEPAIEEPAATAFAAMSLEPPAESRDSTSSEPMYAEVTIPIDPDTTVSIGDDEPLSSYFFEPVAELEDVTPVGVAAEIAAVPVLDEPATQEPAPTAFAAMSLEPQAESRDSASPEPIHAEVTVSDAAAALPAFELVPEAMEAVELLIGVAAVEPSIETTAADFLIEAGQHELNFDVVDEPATEEPPSSYIDHFESTKDAAELVLLQPAAELEDVTPVGVAAEIAAAPVIEALETPIFQLLDEISIIEDVWADAQEEIPAQVEHIEPRHDQDEPLPEASLWDDTELWMALAPELPRAWPRLESFVATAIEAQPLAIPEAQLIRSPEAEATISLEAEPAVVLEAEPIALDAAPATVEPIGEIEIAAVDLGPQIEEQPAMAAAPMVPVIQEATLLLDDAVMPIEEPWTMDSVVTETELWMALPVDLRTWPRLDWFVLEHPPVVLTDGDPLAPVPVSELEAPQEAVLASPRKKKTRKTRKPAQDEWGMFDPEQCGLAAVIAKLDLDEPSDTDRGPRTRHRHRAK